ncbi:MAG: choice-of-anchor Q domain-containing protein, partial [Coraliomargarita sp.]
IWVREKVVAHIVSSTANTGAGSLREAVANANNGDWIVFEFPADAYPATITLDSGIEVSKNLRISGPRPGQLTISSNDGGGFSLFTVVGEAVLTIEQLTLANGYSPDFGGAVSVNTGSGLIARYCHFDNNSADQFGGAIDVFEGSLEVEACLFTNNSVTGSIAVAGGAIATYTIEPCSIINSTFVGNSQQNDGGLGGGAICADNALLSNTTEMQILHCSFKDNFDAAEQGSSILSNREGMKVRVGNSIFEDTQGRVLNVRGNGAIDSLGGNVATDRTVTTYVQDLPEGVVLLDQSSDKLSAPARLAGLSDNGGPTNTCALLPGSAALDHAVDLETPLLVDQRGALRAGISNDSGALEMRTALSFTEIFTGTPDDNYIDAFITLTNSPEAADYDLSGHKVYFDGVLAYTFAGSLTLMAGDSYKLFDSGRLGALPADSAKWSEGIRLNAEFAEITLRDGSGNLVQRVLGSGENNAPGSAEVTSIQRLNISEIFVGTSPTDTDGFIEFYTPREATTFDLEGLRV